MRARKSVASRSSRAAWATPTRSEVRVRGAWSSDKILSKYRVLAASATGNTPRPAEVLSKLVEIHLPLAIEISSQRHLLWKKQSIDGFSCSDRLSKGWGRGHP